MRMLLRWGGVVLSGVLGVVVLGVIAVFAITQIQLNKTYTVQPAPVTVPTDTAAIQRGEHVASALVKCADCHGANLAGSRWIDDPALGLVVPPNLTRGKGGVGGLYTDMDWARVIRHGVKQNGKPAPFMPAEEYYYLSDADLGDLIAYLKTLPPVDTQLPNSSYGLLGYILFATGQLGPLSADIINHTAPRPVAPTPGVTREYGEYLATVGGCRGCHKMDLAGGPIVGAPPDVPPAPNLTPGGELRGWSDADIVKSLRQGVTPTGRVLNEFMPWKATAQSTDDELKALILYLRSVPAIQPGAK